MNKITKRIKMILYLALLLFCCTACRTATADPVADVSAEGNYWPTNGWQTAEPDEYGMDDKKLADMFDYIETNTINIHSVLVVKDGYIVVEHYFGEFDVNTHHIQYSVTKSFVSSLVGIALEEGHIDNIDQTLEDFFPDYSYADEEAKSITLENILTMRTGLNWTEGNPGYYGLSSANDSVEYMLSLPMVHEPGNEFLYCSGCSFLLSAIVQEATDTNTAEYAEENLFTPLGIEDVEWETVPDGTPNGGWGLYLTPRQMAKFGYLFLNEGQWDGEQIIPMDWVHASTEPGRTVGRDVDYGYQWWIFPDDNIYAAQGLYGQKIFVIPDENMVVVMTADLSDDNIEFRLLFDYILQAVVD